MPAVYRSLTGLGLRAAAVGLALAGPGAAEGPELPASPIAESNRLTDPFHRPPVIQLMAADAPWLTPGMPAPMPAGPPVQRQLMPLPPQPPPVSMSVNWSAPSRRAAALAAPLPTSDRPMIPCDMTVPAPPPPPPVAFAPPRMDPPATPSNPEPLPPPRPMSPAPPPPAQPTMTAAPTDAFRAGKPVTTCRFLDNPPPPKPAGDDAVIMAIIRRAGSPGAGVGGLRKTVETTCRTKAVDCQTEVADERQVRVMLTVRSEDDWKQLYARLQDLADMGEYGLLFQVRVEKEAK